MDNKEPENPVVYLSNIIKKIVLKNYIIPAFLKKILPKLPIAKKRDKLTKRIINSANIL